MSVANYPKHLYKSPTYNSWRGMKERCDSPNHVAYERYAGKGYCERWSEFKNFYEDMGERPEGMTLDRRDNSQGYSKDNCRWATLSRQARNKNFKSKTGHKFICPLKNRFHVQVRPFKGEYARNMEEALIKRSKLLELLNHVNFKGDTMLPDTISFTKRKNEGNYNHSELTVTATLEDGEDLKSAIQSLKKFVLEGLDLEVEPTPSSTETVVEKVALKPLGNEPVATANIVKEKAAPRTRAVKPKAEVNESGVEVPPVIPQEAAPSQNTGTASQVVGSVDRENVSHVQPAEPKAAPPVAKGIVAYDSRVKEQRSRFATFLGTTYPKWKTAHPEEKIKEFSLGLQGKPFEDARGNMLDSFKAELEAFFGHAK